jgi:hypothetical protein
MMRIRIPLSVAAATLALAVMTSANAHAKQMKFSGKHPIPRAVEGEFCYIDTPHVHAYEPEDAKVLYREHDGYQHFVGDPVAFGYDGPKHTYYGHHPVAVDPSFHLDVEAEPMTEFCYLDGPHFHHYTPPAGIKFELKGGAYWYIGKYPQHYHKHKKLYVQINIIYKPIVYVRPVVVVAPPVGYLGPIIDIDVDIDVGIGVPGVIIEHPHVHHKHKHYKHKKHKKHKWKH